MPDVLRWHQDEDTLRRIHDSWLTFAGDALDATRRRLERHDRALAGKVTENIHSLSTSALERLLLAPETTFRLLPARSPPLEETAQFLQDAALAELALAGAIAGVRGEVWTALGDAFVNQAGIVVRGPSVAGMMPLDFGSPYSSCIDLSGEFYRVATPREPLTGEDLSSTLAKLEHIRDALAGLGPIIGPFVAQFTKVLVLQKDESQPFGSGSNGDYVGRSVISNPQYVGEPELADGIVHEAIHALLYMQEEQQPWVLDEELYDPVPRIISPWSGRLLPLRPFLQACFVWYGLANFWALACHRGSFETSSSQALFKRAAAGFLRGPLIEKLEPYRSALSIDVIDAVTDMQARVEAALA